MNLVIDIGNTRAKTGIYEKGDLMGLIIFDDGNVDIYETIKKYPKIKKGIVSSVKQNEDALIKEIKNAGIKVIYLNQQTKLPIKNLYQSKETLGYDRIAAAVGANYIFPGTNLLVIDAGTALTIDFINNKGEFIGGNISPGIEMRFKALNQQTQKLPLLQKTEDYSLTGINTNEAIVNGVLNGIVFELEKYMEEYGKQYYDFKTVITGGDAIFFVKKLKNTIFANLNLVLTGLNRILEENEA